MAGKPQIVVHASKSIAATVYDAKWIPSSAKFVALGSYARGTGIIQVYELHKTGLDLVSEHEKSSAIKCGTFGASFLEDRKIAVGDFDGKLHLFDIEKMNNIWSVKGHQGIINAIDGCGGLNIGGGAPEIISGSRDGDVCVWDPRTNNPVCRLSHAEQNRDCWAATFGNSYEEERMICAGYDNGDVKMFDLRTNKLYWETNVGSGVCCIEFDRKDIEMNKLIVTTLGGKYMVYDLRTKHPNFGFAKVTVEAHDSTVWCARHLPQNRDIWMTAGGNGATNLYKYSYPSQRKKKDTDGVDIGVPGKVELLATTEVTTQPILSFDWNVDKEGLGVMAALDQSVKVAIVTKLKNF